MLNSVFSSPTRPPTDTGIAPICNTDCNEVLKHGDGKLNRTLNFVDDCDMERHALYNKCFEERTNDPGRLVADTVHDSRPR